MTFKAPGKTVSGSYQRAEIDAAQKFPLGLLAVRQIARKADGQSLTHAMLRGAFDRARDAAAAAHPRLEKKIREFQFRDLRAKAGTDTEEASGMAAAKDQLGHSSEQMTAHYVRHRRGKLVKPTK
ncbi:MAG: hypothetical protein WKG03_02920 [Telluria sp.]